MGTVEIILSILTFIFGSGSVVSTVLYFKQNKRIKDSEAKKSEVDVDSSFIDNLSKINDEYQESLDICNKDKNYYRTLIGEKDTMIAELNNKLLNMQIELNKKELELQTIKWWKCTCQKCEKREPPMEIYQ